MPTQQQLATLAGNARRLSGAIADPARRQSSRKSGGGGGKGSSGAQDKDSDRSDGHTRKKTRIYPPMMPSHAPPSADQAHGGAAATPAAERDVRDMMKQLPNTQQQDYSWLDGFFRQDA